MKTQAHRSIRSALKAFPLIVLCGGASSSRAAIVSYYVGVDGLQTIATGEFAGLSNPNFGRLTFLYAHPNEATPSSNHYHSKGVFRYQPGSLSAPIVELSPSNYLPEGAAPPLALSNGTGLYSGKLVVLEDPANGFSLIEIKDTGSLSVFAAGTGGALHV
jgi:hypothetical protein